jgi:hypothetical protein
LQSETPRELGDGKDEEVHVEEEEKEEEDDVGPQGPNTRKKIRVEGGIVKSELSQEDGGKDCPASQYHCERVVVLIGVIGVDFRKPEGGEDEGRVGQPETTVTSER